ncbi:MAG: hypothetical protein U0L42_09945 [Methanobrevibacter sp.]|uniref:hypothetical protein n=1 Tax=Methanobrevibacter sp. TaxID=66852 RepID=UPI002E7707EF|nr:hypothetical protein [Methanobrevibacter sp.]MEE0935984.1 hypothetical protein [Methanobrevibacter sp.]
MMDDKGQVSLEYLLIFAVSFIVLIAFTLPLLEGSMSTTFDVSDSLELKSDLSKLSQAIRQVYGQGQGSRIAVDLDMNSPVKINIADNYVSSKIMLKNKQYKEIKIPVKSKLKSTSFKLSKGKNTFVIEWPVESENMIIYKK